MLESAAAAVIAGGGGTRLGGTSKALLRVEGRTILERQLAVLQPLFGEILVVANDPAPFAASGLRVVSDLLAGKGAPGGVHTALAAAAAPWVFCLACDMPFVRPEPIALLASRREGVEVVVPRRASFPEPLFAFYSRQLLAPFSAALSIGDPSLARLISTTRVCFVEQQDFERSDPGARSLENLNTVEDLARLAHDGDGRETLPVGHPKACR